MYQISKRAPMLRGFRPPSIALYVAVICAAGASLLAIELVNGRAGVLAHEPTLLAFLLGITVIAEVKPIKIPHGNEEEDVTISTTFAYALVLGWGWVVGAIALVLGSVASGVLYRRAIWKVAFNAAQYVLAVAAAGIVFRAFASAPLIGDGRFPPRDLAVAFLGGMVFFFVNNTLVASAIALQRGRSVLASNLESFGFQAMLSAGLVALSPAVIVLIDWSLWILPLLVLPLGTMYLGGRAATERSRNEDRYRALAKHAADLVAIVDEEGVFRYVSPSVQPMMGYSPTELIGRSGFDIVHADDLARMKVMFSDVASRPDKITTGEFVAVAADGGVRHFETTFNNLLKDVSVRGIVINARDVTERRVLEQELAHQAFHDSLTKLANRALFLNRVEHALARSVRAETWTAVLFLDVDDFKLINDSLGHPVGDQALVEIARRIALCVRPEDTVARLGGDEFAILLEDTDAEAAHATAARILEEISGPLTIHRQSVVVRASIGIAVTKAGGSPEELLRDADAAMYGAKGLGKSRVVVFEPEMHRAALARLELQADLQRAIESDELFLHYQPIVSLADGRFVGVEALVRWRHPRRGVLSPDVFIPLAEQTGLIDALGRSVLVQACAQAVMWSREHKDFAVNVNISAQQLQRPDFVDDVTLLLKRSGLDPANLVLEITESVLMRDAEESLLRLKGLKRLGVRLAIDDFGTGYSSLSYLKKFPVDILKIDKSFIDGVTRDAEESALARAIVHIGNTLRLRTVAEGIERAEQLERLQALGCGYGQGYYISRPMAPYDISTMLAEERIVAGSSPPLGTGIAAAGARHL